MPLTIAVPKGRILKALAPLLTRANLDTTPLLAEDRRLVRKDNTGTIQYIFLKPDDVPTYVEYGAADLGIAGRDTLLEKKADVYTPLDLRIGQCKLAVAGPKGITPPPLPRIATKYPRITTDFFAKKGIQAEVIAVSGSVELAPLVGLADLIVDVVETGKTLEENNLTVTETVALISTMLIANRAAYKLQAPKIRPLLEALHSAVG